MLISAAFKQFLEGGQQFILFVTIQTLWITSDLTRSQEVRLVTGFLFALWLTHQRNKAITM